MICRCCCHAATRVTCRHVRLSYRLADAYVTSRATMRMARYCRRCCALIMLLAPSLPFPTRAFRYYARRRAMLRRHATATCHATHFVAGTATPYSHATIRWRGDAALCYAMLLLQHAQRAHTLHAAVAPRREDAAAAAATFCRRRFDYDKILTRHAALMPAFGLMPPCCFYAMICFKRCAITLGHRCFATPLPPRHTLPLMPLDTPPLPYVYAERYHAALRC